MGVREQERGSALVMALLLAAGLLILGGSILTVSVADRQIAGNHVDSSRAFGLAEAGIDHSIAELHDVDVDTLLQAGGALWTDEPLGGGTYSTTVANNLSPDFPLGTVGADSGGATDDSDGFLVLTSTGRFQDAVRTIRVVVRKTGSGGDPGPFKWAAFGINQLKASNSVVYGAAGTNGNMSFSGSGPRVVGDAQAVGTISNPAEYVTGTATESAPPEVFPPVACPAIPYGPEPTCPTPPCSGFSFDADKGKISIGGPTILPSGTYRFYELSKSGGDDIVVPLGANVQIYIENKLQMSGGGFTNLNNSAKNLQIWGCDSGSTSDWAVTGSQEVWFTIYAPDHKVKFTGEGDKHGSFIGGAWENSGPGNAYYDAALAGGGGGSDLAVVRGTWSEIF